VRQGGDIISPMIFNVIADAVIREWERSMGDVGGRRETKAQFYADEGLLSGTADPLVEVQQALGRLTGCFARVLGLKMNATKTEAMIMSGGKVRTTNMSSKCSVHNIFGW
jgi:hypothetical protein